MTTKTGLGRVRDGTGRNGMNDEKIDQLHLLARTCNEVVLSGSNLGQLLIRLKAAEAEVERLQAELNGYRLIEEPQTVGSRGDGDFTDFG